MFENRISNPDGGVYNERTAREGRSFWRDLVQFKTGDDATGEARARLNEHSQQEQRLGLNSTGGDGASFIPPCYLEDRWIDAAVAAKPFVSTIPQFDAPKGHTIYVPKISAPGTVGVQATELTTVTNTDQTDQFLSTTLTTIAGQQLISRQLLDQASRGYRRHCVQGPQPVVGGAAGLSGAVRQR